MSVHITGGTLGFSMGPLLFAPAAQHLGLNWTPLLAIPGLIVIGFFLTRVPPITLHHDGVAGFRALRPYAKPLTLLYVIVVLRTLTALGFATFVPVMLTRRGLTVSQAGAIAAAYLFASGAGGFLGGPAADRFGPRSVIAWSLVLATPFLLAAPLLSGWHFIVVLAIGGFFLQSTLPVNVVFGQALARSRGDRLVVDDGIRLGAWEDSACRSSARLRINMESSRRSSASRSSRCSRPRCRCGCPRERRQP
jgi:FSR family fosmidomycin resistance protein-like MFS transporter